MKFYTMKEKSTANFSPNYRSCLTGTCTNGNIVVAGYKYSDDGGATWKDANETTVGDAIYISGNDVWKVFQIPPADEPDFKVYKSTDGGVTYTQVGPTYSYPNANYENFAVAWVISCPAGDFFAITMTLKATGYTFIAMQQLVSVEEWRQMSYDALPGVEGAYGYIPIRTAYFHDASIFFLVQNDMPTNRANSYALIASILPSMTLTYPHYAFNNVGGTNNLWIDFEMDNSAYISKDAFVKLDTETYMVCGALYTDAGVLVEPCLLKNDDVDIVSGWTEVAKERIIPINGTSFRAWGFILDSNKIYLSHNNGKNFFAVTYNAYSSADALVNSTWEGGVEVSDSEWGFGGFDNGKFYTFQETTWASWFSGVDMIIGVGSQVGKCVLEAVETYIDTFFNGFVIILYDSAATPIPLFEGKVTHKVRVGNLYNIELTELKEELTKNKPILTCTTQTVEQIGEALATKCGFCWDGGNITSPGGGADSWSIAYKGGVPISEALDEIVKWVAYVWYTKGDLELIINAGTTSSGKTIGTGGETKYGTPEIASDGLMVATKVIVKGRVEDDGPVIARYPPDTNLDVSTRTGEIIARFLRPSWDYDQCLAFATQIYEERKEWTDVISIAIPLDDTLRPGTTLVMADIDGITNGTYLITQVKHVDGVTEVTLNNTSIAFEDLTKEQEYARNAIDEEFTPQDATESAGSSTIIEKDSIDNLCAGILTKRVSEAQALTLKYDATHKVLLWVDSAGNMNIKPTGVVTMTGNLAVIAGNLFGAFVTWRDAVQWDYSTSAATLTANGNWITKDVSAVVTAGARNVILVTYVATASSSMALRATGATNPVIQLYYNSAFVEAMHVIPLNASLQFDYMVPAGHILYVQVGGWF